MVLTSLKSKVPHSTCTTFVVNSASRPCNVAHFALPALPLQAERSSHHYYLAVYTHQGC